MAFQSSELCTEPQPVKPVGEDRRAARLPGSDLLQRPRWGHVWWGSPIGRGEVDSAGRGLGRSGQELADRKEPLLGVWSLAGRTSSCWQSRMLADNSLFSSPGAVSSFSSHVQPTAVA